MDLFCVFFFNVDIYHYKHNLTQHENWLFMLEISNCGATWKEFDIKNNTYFVSMEYNKNNSKLRKCMSRE